MPKLENGFGRAPNTFNAFVEDTLNRCMEEEQMKLKRKSIGGIWILAVILLLLMGTALAMTGGFGVLDFKKPTNPEALQENVQDLTDTEALETALVSYQVQDALIDGSRVMFTIACEAKNPGKYMLVPNIDPNVGDPVTEKSYAQLANEAGKEMVYVAPPQVIFNGEEVPSRVENSIRDGKLYWLLEPQGVTLVNGATKIECKLHDSPLYGAEFIKETDESLGVEGYLIPDVGEGNDATLCFSLENKDAAAEVETVRFMGPIESEYATIDWVEYTHGNLDISLRVQFTVHENLSKDDLEKIRFLNFRLMNSPDDEYGFAMDGSTGRIDGKADPENIEGVTFLQDVTLVQESIGVAVDTLPDAIYLRPRYTGRVYGDLITLTISEGEMVIN